MLASLENTLARQHRFQGLHAQFEWRSKRVSQKSFKFSEATCQNLHFCSTLPALGSAAVTTYCQLSGLACARRRLSAWHVRLCAGSCNAAVRFGSLSSWVCSWQVLAKRQWKAMQLSAEHVSQQKFWSSGCARGGAGGGLGCAAHVCASAPLLHMETWCCVPRHRHKEWHGRLARRQNIRRQTACLLCDAPLACPRVRCAAADGRDPSHGSATRQ